jgi:hypothetical protein
MHFAPCVDAWLRAAVRRQEYSLRVLGANTTSSRHRVGARCRRGSDTVPDLRDASARETFPCTAPRWTCPVVPVPRSSPVDSSSNRRRDGAPVRTSNFKTSYSVLSVIKTMIHLKLSARLISYGILFFSRNKSVNGTFQFFNESNRRGIFGGKSCQT